MRTLFTILLISITLLAKTQPLLKVGDLFPDLMIRPLLNAPIKSLDVRTAQNKLLILNFWGTWCSPCLPEMDSLARLQVKNAGQIQVIAISNEPVERLQKYLQRKPSTLWLASDTTSNLYTQFAFSYVGQSAIIDQQHRVIALVRTDSINQAMIDRLVRKLPIHSSAETGIHKNAEDETFAVDTSMGTQFIWGSYRKDLPSMSKSYKKTAFEGRRLTFVNMCVPSIYQALYGLSYQQVIFEVPQKEVCSWEQKNRLAFCFDVLVKPEQTDSLKTIMLHLLTRLSPIKTKMEQREMPVYVLRRLPDATTWKESTNTTDSYSFSGRGFEGKGIQLKPFVDYIANELQLPVIDETGLTSRYDIVTSNVLRTVEEVRAALQKLGLTVEKTTRKMDALIIYQ
ncbi:DUF3738 domain-containing protein [Paraflavitalea sp. CAU 1676]|uniref:DUF3738 domain-containing protein n=1 Tax=Paraflavitalea sp. CAU 1676 TaxID=3032598 RepID=UPI0023DC1FAA|nr:DUF3738 domain-containing protein [Paraflavitalea sp. CAU 1676]MDF2190485.1 DUF3738 domain-containing protein [Paraflavitalea sp. CAU 1676]